MTAMAPISADMMRKIRLLRQMQRISAQTLADRITALGYPVTRAQVANYEGDRKNSLPIDFVVLAAQALGSTAIELLAGPAKCPTCEGSPPVGFTCQTCRAEAPVQA